MAASQRALPRMSIEAFRRFVEDTPDEQHWELIDGVAMMMAPPTGTAALTTVIARARSRMNQVFATIVGAWTKPAVNEMEITPR